MEKIPYAKVTGQTAAGAGVASVVAWAWNISFPESAMPAEVAAALGGVIGPAIKYVVGWLPAP